MNVSEKSVRSFWEAHPCGESLVSTTSSNADWPLFFEKYDTYRYSTEGHILGELDNLNVAGKKVLEIGSGQAADAEQIIRRGGCWSGLDLTDEAVLRGKKRFELKGLKYDDVKQGSALKIPYPDKVFDIVYSHGTLHHIPEVNKASQEIFRVLKPEGELVIMLYNKNSLNYRLSINFIRRFLMVGLSTIARVGAGRWIRSALLKRHLVNARDEGLFSYLRNPRFLYANTDGPDNPYSKVYDRSLVEQDFWQFEVKSLRCYFLNERHLPGLKILPRRIVAWLAANYGWHLWATLKPRTDGRS